MTDYQIGYGRPPSATRFRPGQSGNPKGRQKGTKNFATVIEQELNARISVTENGRRRTISKRQAVAKQLVNKAAGGDTKAIPMLLNEARLHEGAPGGPGLAALARAEDALVMESILRRIRQAEPVSPEPAEAGEESP